jgi:chemotaxis protein CheD
LSIHGNKIITIHIGEVYASNSPAVIYTLLGSCVAVCLYDAKNRIGGINHVFLPGNSNDYPTLNKEKWGENTMKSLIEKVFELGGERRNLIAKVFGGAHLISNVADELRIGSKIVDYVRDFLEREKIPIVAWDFGGDMARKVYFHTDTGNAYVKQMPHYRDFFNKEYPF